MKHIKTFQLWENHGASGEYNTEEMDKFVRAVAELANWAPEEHKFDHKSVKIYVPSDRNSSSTSHSKEELSDNWQSALDKYGKDRDVKWYVWNVDVGGSFNKPKQISSQRYDIDSILAIVQKYPEAFRNMTVGHTSEEQRKFGDYISKEFYGPGKYSGD